MAEHQTVAQKIQELFAYRRIPELLRMAGIEQDSPFVARLYTLQRVMYALDQYLETHWKLEKKELKARWTDIHEALCAFGIRKSKQPSFLKGIVRYENYERDLRKRKLPLSEHFTSLYTSKSCDVKLVRRLIYRHAPELKRLLKEKEWEYYDLITEINDDIHDVYEDCETINGNRFLIGLLLKGKRKTWRAYKRFLEETGDTARKHFRKKKGEFRIMLYQWTRERLRETEELLRLTMDDQKLSLVEHSAIAGKILKGKLKRAPL